MKDTVLTLLRDKHYSELRDMLVEMYAADIASLLESLESRERALIFRCSEKIRLRKPLSSWNLIRRSNS